MHMHTDVNNRVISALYINVKPYGIRAGSASASYLTVPYDPLIELTESRHCSKNPVHTSQ